MSTINTYIMIIYDGINNSVFESQVLQPLVARKEKFPEEEIILISFEYPTSYAKKKLLYNKIPSNIICIILCKFPFFGLLSLYPAIKQLRLTLKKLKNYSIISRGPLAAWCALSAINISKCKNLIIQARGLLAEEYAYEHQYAPAIKKMWHRWKTTQYKKLEDQVYIIVQKYNKHEVMIEAVSSALQTYLKNNYHLSDKKITVESVTISLFSQEQLLIWKQKIRAQLAISQDAFVYCYNGSAKLWQCPLQTLLFFKNEYEQNSNSFLLILTQDIQEFHKIVKSVILPTSSYYLLTISPRDIYHYLAAADAGLIFREPHILNWISRPTKVLEYQAVKLPIIHNNTVAYMQELEEIML